MLLHLEGLAMLAVAVLLYAHTGGNGWLFLALLLVPDLSMVGYALNTTTGARVYNAAHTLSVPLLLGGVALMIGSSPGMQLALIWIAHIGMDRAIGYGLKYNTHFKATFMQRV
ncbi:MAG: DUF4260 domain-containing protein [Anaerolineae bacterium]